MNRNCSRYLWLMLAAAALWLAPAAAVQAGPEERAARRASKQAEMAPLKEARAFRKLVVEGEDLETAAAKLDSLTWHQTLQAAQADAKKQNKPIIWFQALGDLDGFL